MVVVEFVFLRAAELGFRSAFAVVLRLILDEMLF